MCKYRALKCQSALVSMLYNFSCPALQKDNELVDEQRDLLEKERYRSLMVEQYLMTKVSKLSFMIFLHGGGVEL